MARLALVLVLALVGSSFGGLIRDIEFEKDVVVEADTPSQEDVSLVFQLLMECVNKKLQELEKFTAVEKEVDIQKGFKVRGSGHHGHHGNKGFGSLLDLGLKDISGALLANVPVKHVLNDNNINIPVLSTGVTTVQESKFGNKKHHPRSFNDFFAFEKGTNVGTNSFGGNNQIATQTQASNSNINQASFAEFLRAVASNTALNSGDKGVVIDATNQGNENVLGIQQGNGAGVGGGFNMKVLRHAAGFPKKFIPSFPSKPVPSFPKFPTFGGHFQKKFDNDFVAAFGGTNVGTNNVGNNNQLATQTHTFGSSINQGMFPSKKHFRAVEEDFEADQEFDFSDSDFGNAQIIGASGGSTVEADQDVEIDERFFI